MKAEWISLAGIEWKEEDVEADEIHWTRAGTRKILNIIQARVKEATKKDYFDGMGVQAKTYGGIHGGHWKVGCYRCTRMHPKGTCPPLPELDLDESSNSNNASINTSNNASIISSFHSVEGPNADNSEDGVSLHSSLGSVAHATPPQATAPLATSLLESPWSDIATPPLNPTPTWDEMAQPAPSDVDPVREAYEIHSTYSRMASRSSSQKRALDTSSNTAEKKQKTKTDGPANKGHTPRNKNGRK